MPATTMNNIRFYNGAIDPSGCISNGWNLIKPNYWMYFAIGLLAMLMISCIPCLNVLLLGPVNAGVYYVLLRDMRDEPVDFGMMFKGFEKIIPTLIVGLLQSVPGIIWQVVNTTADLTRILMTIGRGASGSIFYQSDGTDVAIAGGLVAIYIVLGVLFFLFSIAWAITFSFALPLVMEHDISPIEAIKLSAKAGWSNVGGIIVISIFMVLMSIVGVLALCVGIFFVIPVFYAAWAFVYRQVFPAVDAPFNSAPPLPHEYGGSFGRGM